MTWAWTVPVETAAQRSVLTAYAWRAGSRLIAWPGLEQLSRDTMMHSDTISAARRRVVQFGYLVDTGQRKGMSGRVTVYRLAVANTQGNRGIQSPGKSGYSSPQTPRKTDRDTPENPATDTPENRGQNYELNKSMNSSARDARERAQPEERQPLEPAQRAVEIETAMDKVRRAFPNLMRPKE